MLRSIVLQALIFFIAFQVLSFFRQTSMLSTDVDIVSNKITSNVPTLNGNMVSLQSNGKTTILYFFAPWCQICHISIGNLQTLAENNDSLQVIAVALDYANVEEVASFTTQHQLTFPIALGNETIKQAFSISGYPSYYVVNGDNIIIGKSMGYSSELGLYLRSL